MTPTSNVSFSVIQGFLCGMVVTDAEPTISTLVSLNGDFGRDRSEQLDPSHVIEIDGWLIPASGELVDRAISWSRG